VRAILLGGGLALLISLIGTRFAIRQFTRWGYGQEVRDDGPTTHHVKRGTPTMGGVVIIGATVLGYLGAKLITLSPPTASALLLLLLFVGIGAVGFLDDFIKIYKQRSLGLRSKAKIVGQTVVGLTFGILALSPVLEDDRGQRPASFSISFIRDFDSLVLPAAAVVALILVMVIATSNATNLTDGADGLLTGCSMMVFGAYTIVNIWQNNQWCGQSDITYGKCYEVRDPLDLAIVAAAITGACFGFLWWNASPAQIFMGDTGSLALGAALAGLAVLTRTELLLVIVGGVFVMETVSVMLQVSWFKLSRRLTGSPKRLFRMAPIHHTFDMAWGEVTMVIRFWILTGLCVAGGLGIFYAEWVAGT
jgi:phospho-N-acetylmuramoyl-pentapeptide-transferase